MATPVVNIGVWQSAQPMLVKRALPCCVDAVGAAAAGGASRRMKFAKASMSESTAVVTTGAPGGGKLLVSLGLAAPPWQPEVSSRSCGNNWFEMPISTL